MKNNAISINVSELNISSGKIVDFIESELCILLGLVLIFSILLLRVAYHWFLGSIAHWELPFGCFLLGFISLFSYEAWRLKKATS